MSFTSPQHQEFLTPQDQENTAGCGTGAVDRKKDKPNSEIMMCPIPMSFAPMLCSGYFFSITGMKISERHWVFVSFRIFWPRKWWHFKLWNTGTNCQLSVAWVQKTLLVIEAFISIGMPNSTLTLCITCGLAHTCSYQSHKRTGPPPTRYHLFTHLYRHSNSPFLL